MLESRFSTRALLEMKDFSILLREKQNPELYPVSTSRCPLPDVSFHIFRDKFRAIFGRVLAAALDKKNARSNKTGLPFCSVHQLGTIEPNTKTIAARTVAPPLAQ